MGRKNRSLLLLLPLGGALIGGAWWLRDAPRRAEAGLQRADLGALERLIRREPGNARAFYHFGLRLQSQGKVGPARAALIRAATLAPDDAQIALALVALTRSLGNPGEAHAVLTRFVEKHPDNVEVSLALAEFYQSQYEAEAALKILRPLTESPRTSALAWRLRAVSAFQIEAFDEVERSLSAALKIVSDDWRSHFLRGELLAVQKKYTEALASYEAAARHAPDMGEPLLGVGKTRLELAATPAELNEAAATLEKAVARLPLSANALLSLGIARYRQKRYEDSRVLLTRSQALQPTLSATATALRRTYQALGDAAAAKRQVALLEKLTAYTLERDRLLADLQNRADPPDKALRLARLCAAHGDFSVAQQWYRRLINHPKVGKAATEELSGLVRQLAAQGAVASDLQLAAGHSTAGADTATLKKEAQALLSQGRTQEALQRYQDLVARDPGDLESLESLGLLLDRPESQSASFEILSRVVARDPARERAAFALVGQYRRAGFEDVARERMEALARRFPDRARYQNALGEFYRTNDTTFAAAAQAFEKAVRLEPGNAEYVLNLGRALALINRLPEAEKRLREGLALSGNAPEARVSLAAFLSTQVATPEHLKEAEQLLRSAIQEQPDNPAALKALGALLLQQGKARDAIAPLEKAIETAPENEMFYHLSRAYVKVGNKQRAEYCQKVFEKNQRLATDLSEAIEKARLQKENAPLRLKLARLYKEYSDINRSINQYQVYLKLNPGDKQAKKELEALQAGSQSMGGAASLELFNKMTQNARVGR